MAEEANIESLIKKVAELNCSDEPLKLILSLVPASMVIRSKLVRKLFRTKKLGHNVVRGIFMQFWEREHDWVILEVDENLFVFHFCKEEDKKFVQDHNS
ncbi:hypothetical protein PanWU01x14_276710 [Parasponia andersonii]|uniref:DUF4283 domain-containing protein n=1 Tax=Parasponia andersonii TaxID=3476 RepID=A0A2P5B2W7_PARAD|nr:hypothetical protein PanWU01x14_276710 [Parasponia andersonii]